MLVLTFQTPLIQNELVRAGQSIETSLTGFVKRIKVLTDHLNRIGTDTDDHEFRLEVTKELGATANLASQLRDSITKYGLISVPFAEQADRNDKQQAYNQKLSELVGKFQDVTKKIKDKEQLYFELA